MDDTDDAAHADGSHRPPAGRDGPDLDLTAMRRAYEGRGIDTETVAADPFTQFQRWLDDAVAGGVVEPNAMTLATVDSAGRPAARTVLLKGLQEGTFVFYSNYTSRKAAHLAATPACALLFAWMALARQVAVRGTVERLDTQRSDEYFASRPRGSQIGAWASPQSTVIAGRDVLDREAAEVAARFPDVVPRPPHWGGYRVVPDEIEFWQGRANRLHDRLRYRPARPDGWRIERLAP